MEAVFKNRTPSLGLGGGGLMAAIKGLGDNPTKNLRAKGTRAQGEGRTAAKKQVKVVKEKVEEGPKATLELKSDPMG